MKPNTKAKIITTESFENFDMMRLRASVAGLSSVAIFVCGCLKETRAPACSNGASGLLHYFKQRSKNCGRILAADERRRKRIKT
jgi:hypothetical protein